MSTSDRVQVKFKTTRAQREALNAEARRRGVTSQALLRAIATKLTGLDDGFRPYSPRTEDVGELPD